ncbi:MAG: TonB family protein [Bryobacteraceae bacterium]
MRYALLELLTVILSATSLLAQIPPAEGEPIRVGPGVTAPRVIRKVEPEFTSEARSAQIQGVVILQVIIDEKGHPTDISILSPLGFGLDERAVAALEKWEFVAGKNAGVPVKILATVEVNFRFLGLYFDEKTERRRTAFNIAAQTIGRAGAKQPEVDKAVESILDLSRQKFIPALYLVGVWKVTGQHVAEAPDEGFEMIQKAAAKNYGPAIYDVALRRITGRGMPLDVEKGLQAMRDASTLGSPQAQFHLGNRYEKGDGVPPDLDRAQRYFRLCAAQDIGLCQYRLGLLLYEAPERRERNYLQALALFRLASAKGVPEAGKISADEAPKLTAEQSAWVARLKDQIVRK